MNKLHQMIDLPKTKDTELLDLAKHYLDIHRNNPEMQHRIQHGTALVALGAVLDRHPLYGREIVAEIYDWQKQGYATYRSSHKVAQHDEDIWCSCLDDAPEINGSIHCAHVWAYKILKVLKRPFAKRTFYGFDDLKVKKDVNGRGTIAFTQVVGANDQKTGNFVAYPRCEFRRALSDEIICMADCTTWRITDTGQRLRPTAFKLPADAEATREIVTRLAERPHFDDGRAAFRVVTDLNMME